MGSGLPFHGGPAGEDGEDGGVGVVVGDGADGVVELEVVLAGRVVAAPPDHVVRAEVAAALEHLPDVFVVDLNGQTCTLHSYFLS